MRLCDHFRRFRHLQCQLTVIAVSLDQLSAQQLTAVKKQLDEEVEHLTTSFAQLQAAQIKFKDCLRCVKTQGGTQGEQTPGDLRLMRFLLTYNKLTFTEQTRKRSWYP